jgi:hypothetical protein
MISSRALIVASRSASRKSKWGWTQFSNIDSKFLSATARGQRAMDVKRKEEKLCMFGYMNG